MHLRPEAAESSTQPSAALCAKSRQLRYVTQHIIIVVCEFFSNFALESRDAWCLQGGLTPGVGWFVLHTKGVYQRLILGYSEPEKF